VRGVSDANVFHGDGLVRQTWRDARFRMGRTTIARRPPSHVHRMGTVRFRFMDGFDRKLGLKVLFLGMFARISRLADHYFPAGPNMGSLSKETASLPHRIPVSRETVKS